MDQTKSTSTFCLFNSLVNKILPSIDNECDINITIKIILSESLWTQLVLHIVTILRCVIMNGKKKMIWKNIWEKLHFVTNHNFTYHQIVTTKIMAKCVIIKKTCYFIQVKVIVFPCHFPLLLLFHTIYHIVIIVYLVHLL